MYILNSEDNKELTEEKKMYIECTFLENIFPKQ